MTELHEASAAELRRLLDTGQLSATEFVRSCLDRIDALDRQGPELGAIIETNPDALDVAAACDRERAADPSSVGPLHGIPVVVKDNIATHDRLTTTAGSLALEGSIPDRDAFIIAALRAAGAIVLAKANMSEWANFRGKPSTSGWSGRGGQCRNPHDVERTPCGSSSGSAVAVAAGYAPLAIGTETNGSIVCPASVTGIVGLKPTVGLWSRSGIIPISHSQDTAGPMTRTVADAAALLGIPIGGDPDDPVTADGGRFADTDFAAGLAGSNDLTGRRIGVARVEGFDPRIEPIFEAALDALREAGAELIDPVPLALPPKDDRGPLTVLEYEFKAGLNAYLAALGPDAPVADLAAVIAFNEQHADRELQHFGQELLISSQERGPLTDAAYLDALTRVQRRHRANLDAILDGSATGHPVDAIAMPTRDPAWLTDHVHGDPGGGSTSSPAAIAGYPNLTVPMGHVDGLPVGIGFVGRPWSEATLLAIGHAFERRTADRRLPMPFSR